METKLQNLSIVVIICLISEFELLAHDDNCNTKTVQCSNIIMQLFDEFRLSTYMLLVTFDVFLSPMDIYQLGSAACCQD